MKTRGRYGVDAAYVPALMVLGGCVMSAFAALQSQWSSRWSWLISAVFFFATAGSYLYTTLRGKFVVWHGLLDELKLREDAQVLDVGCGRGAVLLMAAKRLTTGRAVGVDLFRAVDQTGNSRRALEANADAEGVRERVEVVEADMRAMPIDAKRFDAVVSSLAIHNVPDTAGREKALAETFRVLAPKGKAYLVDFKYLGEYAATWQRLGGKVLREQSLGPRFWYGGPWAAAKLLVLERP